jgi:hypothetical protein
MFNYQILFHSSSSISFFRAICCPVSTASFIHICSISRWYIVGRLHHLACLRGTCRISSGTEYKLCSGSLRKQVAGWAPREEKLGRSILQYITSKGFYQSNCFAASKVSTGWLNTFLCWLSPWIYYRLPNHHSWWNYNNYCSYRNY